MRRHPAQGRVGLLADLFLVSRAPRPVMEFASKCLVEFIGTFFLAFTVACAAGQGAALAGLGIGSVLMCSVYAARALATALVRSSHCGLCTVCGAGTLAATCRAATTTLLSRLRSWCAAHFRQTTASHMSLLSSLELLEQERLHPSWPAPAPPLPLQG